MNSTSRPSKEELELTWAGLVCVLEELLDELQSPSRDWDFVMDRARVAANYRDDMSDLMAKVDHMPWGNPGDRLREISRLWAARTTRGVPFLWHDEDTLALRCILDGYSHPDEGGDDE